MPQILIGPIKTWKLVQSGKRVCGAVLLLLAAGPAPGQVVTYQFGSGSGNGTPPVNGAMDPFTRVNLTASAGGDVFQSVYTAGGFDASSYVTFGARANTGYALHLTSLDFKTGRAADGPPAGVVTLFSSGGTAIESSPTYTTANSPTPAAAPTFGFQRVLTDRVAFRLYNYGGAAGGTLSFDDVTLNGAVSPTFGSALTLAADTRVVTDNSMTFFNPIAGGSFGITKLGTGTATLQAANTYGGNTTVGAGTLALSGGGSVANSPVVTVAGGATLSVGGVTNGFSVAPGQTIAGNGTVSGTMAVGSGATISPGESVGTLTTGSQAWNGGGGYDWELSNPAEAAGAGFDMVQVHGDLTIGATSGSRFVVTITPAGGLSAASIPRNTWFTMANVTGTVNRSLVNTAIFELPDPGVGQAWDIRAVDGATGGTDIQVSATPEPGAVGVAAVSLAVGLLRRRRRQTP